MMTVKVPHMLLIASLSVSAVWVKAAGECPRGKGNQ